MYLLSGRCLAQSNGSDTSRGADTSPTPSLRESLPIKPGLRACLGALLAALHTGQAA